MTFDEIVAKMRELGINEEKFGDEDFDYQELENAVGEWEEVDSYGGEDQGSDYFIVVRFIEHNVYMRLDGYYRSYEGTNWSHSSFQEVFPTEVKRIEYLPVRK